MQKVIERLKLIGSEILNFLTNIVIPVWGIIMLVAEVFGVPDKYLSTLKNIEYLLFEVSGTKDKIEHNDN